MPPTVASKSAVAPARWATLDALRGFAMFWLVGGEQLVKAIAAGAEKGSWREKLQQQFTYSRWDGYHFYDLIMPLFMFALGVALPLSIAGRMERGDDRRKVVKHALLRTAILILLGWCVSGNLLSWRFNQMALGYSYLQMLALGYLLATLLVAFAGVSAQIAITAIILVASWAAQMFVHVPGHEAGQFVEGRILSDWLFDVTLAKLGAPFYSPYGRGWPFFVWNCGAAAMLGVFAAYIARPGLAASLVKLRQPALEREPNKNPKSAESGSTAGQRLAWLCALGAICLAVGWGWSYHLPLVRSRWTSSYVLWSAGWAYGLFALFFGLLEIAGARRGMGLLLAIGANSILAYLFATVFPNTFESTAEALFGGLSYYASSYVFQLFMTAMTYLLVWLLLVFLRRQRIFIRV